MKKIITMHSMTFSELEKVGAPIIRIPSPNLKSFTYSINGHPLQIDDRITPESWRKILRRVGIKSYNLAAVRRQYASLQTNDRGSCSCCD